MGAGASAGLEEKVAKASEEEIREAIGGIPPEVFAKLQQALLAEEEGEKVELSFVLDEIFKCFDLDKDGQIGREEYLECWEKLSEILGESFNPKQRKVKMQWYKDAGAAGEGNDLYLDREKWQTAFVSTAAEESKISATEETKLGSWIWKSYAKKLVALCFPDSAAAASVAAADDGRKPPTYPKKIPLTELAGALDEAKEWGYRALVCSSGLSEVGTYFEFRIPTNLTCDISDMFLMKGDEKKAFLKRGMEYEGLCAPIHIKMGSGANDINKSCDKGMPAEVFDSASWTPKAAKDQDFISEGMCAKLEADDSGKSWKDFTIVISSELSLEDAKAKLSDKIPYFDKLALIAIDPDSVSKG